MRYHLTSLKKTPFCIFSFEGAEAIQQLAEFQQFAPFESLFPSSVIVQPVM